MNMYLDTFLLLLTLWKLVTIWKSTCCKLQFAWQTVIGSFFTMAYLLFPGLGFKRWGGRISGGWRVEIWSVFYLYLYSRLELFLTKFCSCRSSFNGNILTFLYLKAEIYVHAQLVDYSFIPTVYKFHDMVLVGNLNWGSLLINGVYR